MIKNTLRSARVLCLTVGLALALLLQSCASLPDEKKLVQDGVTLYYKPRVSGGNDLESLRLDHPYEASEESVRNQLLALHFEELSMFGKIKPIFSVDDAGKLARFIAKALQRASAEAIVYYELSAKTGKVAGEVFISGKRFNWRFYTIRGVDFAVNMTRSASWRTGQSTVWRVKPRAGQAFFASARLTGKQAREDWLIADLDIPASRQQNAKKSAEENKPAAAKPEAKHEAKAEDTAPAAKDGKDKKSRPDLEEKLQFLKELQQKGLIDEKDYQRKRKELLDSYL